MSKITSESQKGQNVVNLTEDQAREHIERLLWPNGEPVCPHCGSVNAYKMAGNTGRPGLCRCRDCDKQFTVTVGTIFEDTHIPLAKWVWAFHMMASSKKGISALQLQRNLGLGSYRSAWHMAHRIRLAMRCEPMAGALKNEVQADETYVGASHHGKKDRAPRDKPRKRGRGTLKTPVFALVESAPGGKAYACPVERVTSENLKATMQECVDSKAAIVTDDLRVYPKAVADFEGGHYTVNHSHGQYVRKEDGRHTNGVESFFALLKRGHYGVFHQLSKKHLHRYCDEFSFRWSNRLLKDSERRALAIKQVKGKRLMYRAPVGGLMA